MFATKRLLAILRSGFPNDANGDTAMVGENIRIPKKGERVCAQGQNGTFIVSQISIERRTANLKLIGPVDYVLKEIPWGALIFFDKPLGKWAKKKAGEGTHERK